MTILFAPKALILFAGNDIGFEKKKANKYLGDAAVAPTDGATATAGAGSRYTDTAGAIVLSKAALKGLTSDQKSQLCAAQVAYWREEMIRIGEQNTGSGSGSGSASGAASASASKGPSLGPGA
jgi:hypothetical protein